MSPISSLEEYLKFSEELDHEVSALAEQHARHLVCHDGCDKCCLNFKVFPVEYFAILAGLGLSSSEVLPLPASPDTEEIEPCVFLHDHSCSIYPHRPIICRTHGLPLLNMNESGDAWELSFCELNFLNADEDEFDEDNVLMQDTVNSKLFQINSRFLEANPHLPFSKTELVSFRRLKHFLEHPRS
jgi:Fe-S-cluster containining protein